MFKIPHFLCAGALLVSSPLYAQTVLAPPNSSIPITRTLGVPGVRREAGAWLFNESIFVAPGENLGAAGGAVFLPNLRRDKKNKLPLFRAATTRGPLSWATLPLPDLRSMNAPGFDFAGLQAQLTAQVNAARAAGRVYVGWSLPTLSDERTSFSGSQGDWMTREKGRTLDKSKTLATLKQLRALLDAVAPESALILQVSASDSQARQDIDTVAPSCDAVCLGGDIWEPEALWSLKMARRVAEEQKDFDLPIFIGPNPKFDSALSSSLVQARMLEFFMGGATGFVLPDAQTPSWASAFARNPGLFSGAVTLEDAAVLPSFNPQIMRLVAQLRAVGRVPLVGRLPADDETGPKNGESLFAVLDDQTSLETLNGLDKAARAGNTIYLEDAPNLKTPALLTKLSDMTSTAIEVLPATKNEVLTLSDPWTFGSVRGQEIGVMQRLKWTPKTSLAAQTRKKKGEDLLQPFSAAKLANDENGLLVAPLGKGRLVWLAHPPLNTASNEAARRSFYAAIIGNLQGALASFRFDSVEDSIRNGDAVHLALRASKTGTPIVALFNEGAVDATISLSCRGDAPLALDLSTDREIAATVSGYSSTVKVTVPAHGFTWLTFGATRATLDKERLATRLKARIVK